jgi:hypothetical protein
MADFYLDHNVADEIAKLLRTRGHEAVAARDLHLERAKDDEQLLTAAQRGWILVTHNQDDFFLLHDAWRRWATAWGVPAAHAGILVLAQAPPTRIPRTRLAHALDEIASSGVPLANELYSWRPASGWQHRP